MLLTRDRFHRCGVLLPSLLIEKISATRGGWKNRSLEKPVLFQKKMKKIFFQWQFRPSGGKFSMDQINGENE